LAWYKSEVLENKFNHPANDSDVQEKTVHKSSRRVEFIISERRRVFCQKRNRSFWG
jgi:hypothetical protein